MATEWDDLLDDDEQDETPGPTGVEEAEASAALERMMYSTTPQPPSQAVSSLRSDTVSAPLPVGPRYTFQETYSPEEEAAMILEEELKAQAFMAGRPIENLSLPKGAVGTHVDQTVDVRAARRILAGVDSYMQSIEMSLNEIRLIHTQLTAELQPATAQETGPDGMPYGLVSDNPDSVAHVGAARVPSLSGDPDDLATPSLPRGAPPYTELSGPARAVFSKIVDDTEGWGHWLWLGQRQARTQKPIVRWGGTMTTVSRALWEITHSRPFHGADRLFRVCVSPLCVRPTLPHHSTKRPVKNRRDPYWWQQGADGATRAEAERAQRAWIDPATHVSTLPAPPLTMTQRLAQDGNASEAAWQAAARVDGLSAVDSAKNPPPRTRAPQESTPAVASLDGVVTDLDALADLIRAHVPQD